MIARKRLASSLAKPRKAMMRAQHAQVRTMLPMSSACVGIAICLSAGSAIGQARVGTAAESYPTKPIRMIIPYPAGGPTDITARIVAQKLTDALGRQVIVDNRGGGSVIIGTEMVARAAPDGYTILCAAVPHVVNPSLYKKLPYDTVNDFLPLTEVLTYTNILVVHPSVPATSVPELIALAKARPKFLTYGSAGPGTSLHLSAELLKSMAGVDIVQVPYKGTAGAITDLEAGQISMVFDTTLSVLPHVRSGRLRALAVTSAQRSPFTPDLPTVAESGLPGYEVTSWVGMLAPARTPEDVIGRLNNEIVKLLKLPEVRARIAELAAVPVGSSADQLGSLIKAEIAKWGKVIREGCIKTE